MKVRQRACAAGWTTGTCAAAAAKAALLALATGQLPEAVEVPFPSGRPAHVRRPQWLRPTARRATAVVVKDAGDDPDVTHGAHLTATVDAAARASDVVIAGGDGVGTVTKPGLGLEVGGPAINPVPRQMITEAVARGRADRRGARDDQRARRREDGPQDHQPPAGDRRRHLDPRHHRDRAAVLHRVVARVGRAGGRR